MKHAHSVDWFEENFKNKKIEGLYYCYGTVNGNDYSFESNAADMARILALAWLQNNGHVINEDVREKEREITRLQKQIEENSTRYEQAGRESEERYKGKLMAVYYNLTSVDMSATHHEKRVIIKNLKNMIGMLINQGDTLPYEISHRYNHLPF